MNEVLKQIIRQLINSKRKSANQKMPSGTSVSLDPMQVPEV